MARWKIAARWMADALAATGWQGSILVPEQAAHREALAWFEALAAGTDGGHPSEIR